MEKIYEIEFIRKGRVYVKADSSIEALDIANRLSEYAIKWDHYWAANGNKELTKEQTKDVVCANEKDKGKELLYVTHYVNGTFVSEVMADDVDDAIEKANKKINSADFGQLSVLEMDVTMVEDEDGEYLFEK